MPITHKGRKVAGFRFDGSGKSFQTASVDGIKNTGGSWFNIGSPGQKQTNNNPARGPRGGLIRNDPRYPHLCPVGDGVKQGGGDWFSDPTSISRTSSGKSLARKMASAKIAKIPLPLASHIARVYHP